VLYQRLAYYTCSGMLDHHMIGNMMLTLRMLAKAKLI
jgi:hypothetical protein